MDFLCMQPPGSLGPPTGTLGVTWKLVWLCKPHARLPTGGRGAKATHGGKAAALGWAGGPWGGQEGPEVGRWAIGWAGGPWGGEPGADRQALGRGTWARGRGEGSWSRQAGPGAGRWTMGWSGGPWGGQVGPGGSLSAASSARWGFVGNDSGISLRTRPATEGRK